MDRFPYDVFLSHHDTDTSSVEILAHRLYSETGLRAWFAKWDLVPGTPRQEALEAGIAQSQACAVFIGPAGLGSWHQEEMRIAIEARVDGAQLRVIPVLLPGANLPERGELPPFLARHTWVDFRAGLDDAYAYQSLVSGVKGVAPRTGPQLQAQEICPYVGLYAFQESHAQFFFGQDALVQWLVEDLRHDNFVSVIGPSGSGKSSAVQAGLIPALRRNALPASAYWHIRMMTPGSHPLSALASRFIYFFKPQDPLTARHALAQRLQAHPGELARVADQVLSLPAQSGSGSGCILLLVDQFEELFTLCRDESARAAFIRAILDATQSGRRGLKVILTMRSDFYSRAAAYHDLATRMERRQRLVSPMDQSNLRLAVEQPANLVNLHFEKGLVDTILDDVGSEPGVLPLIQHTLWELWHRRRGQWLTFDAYRAIGGVQGALAHRAEEVYASFSPAEQRVARRILLRLTQPGEGTEDTRRRATKQELIPEPDQALAVEQVINRLADFRLLTTGKAETEQGQDRQDVVDVSHEALIRGWPRLQDWVNRDRAGLLIHRQLTEATGNWLANNRDASYLYSGVRLVQAQAWAKANPNAMNAQEREFLAASHSRQRRGARLRLAAIGVIGLLLLVITSLGFWSQHRLTEQERQASATDQARLVEVQEESQKALARQLGAQAELVRGEGVGKLELSTLLAIESMNRLPSLEADQALRTNLALLPELSTVITVTGTSDSLWMAIPGQWTWWDPTNRWLAVNYTSTVRIWDIATGQEVTQLSHDSDVQRLAFSPDGTLVAVIGSPTIEVWQVTPTEQVSEIRDIDEVTDVVLSPDSRWLAVVRNDLTEIYDTETGRRSVRMAHSGRFVAAVFSPDGQWIATASEDRTARLWEVSTGDEIMGVDHNAAVLDIAFDPGGRRLITVADDHTAHTWQVDTGDEESRMQYTQEDFLDLSPDGKWLVTIGGRSAYLWNVEEGERVANLTYGGSVVGVKFGPDAPYLSVRESVPYGALGEASVWNLLTGQEVARVPHNDWMGSPTPSENGQFLATYDWGSVIQVWRVVDTRSLVRSSIETAATSPDGQWIATSSENGLVQIWDASNGREIYRASYPPGAAVWGFSHDGQLLAIKHQATVYVHDVAANRTVTELSIEGQLEDTGYHPDGSWLIAARDESIIRVWDARTGQRITQMEIEGQVGGKVGFSPDGVWLAATTQEPATAHLWNAKNGDHETLVVHGEASTASRYSFSPDGQWLAQAGDTVKIWDVTTGEMRSEITAQSYIWSMCFSPDGQQLAAGLEGNTAQLWDVNTGAELMRFAHHPDINTVFSVEFSSDGQWLATAGAALYGGIGEAAVWNVSTGEKVTSLMHPREVIDVAFSSDGRWLASASWDKWVRIWDVETAAAIASQSVEREDVRVTFTANDSWILTSYPGYCRTCGGQIWPWKPGMMVAEACRRLARNMTAEEWNRYLPSEPYAETCPGLP